MNREASTIEKKSRTDNSDLIQQIDFSAIPKHVAIIMDGNGRWARARSIPRIQGHRAGVKAVDEVVTCAREIGIKVLTLYAFSMENWQRPKEEIRSLMYLLKEYIIKKIKVMKQKNIRFMAIGRIEELPKDIQSLLKQAEDETRQNDGLILNLALSYGGRTEIVDAVRSILKDLSGEKIRIDQVDEALISSRMYTAELPDPDIMIRTSGEQRISNFLPWQSVYTELYFSPIWWPDFRRTEFLEAIINFQKRERRFGLTGEQIKTNKGKEDAF